MSVMALVPVTFRFPGNLAPRARQVCIAGSFNRWDPESHPLKPTSDGDWTATIYLPPGRVVYCYWVDGTVWLDPGDDGRVPNAWGSEYSVRFIPPDASPSRARSA